MALAPAGAAAQDQARKESKAASEALMAGFDADETGIQDQIDALEEKIGTARAPTAEESKKFDDWNAELDDLNNKRRAIIFIDFATLPTRANVNKMLAQVQSARTQLQADKAAVAGVVEKVKRIQARVDQASKVIATLTKLATLVV